MKVLLFGDGPTLKDKGKALREQNGWTVHLRSVARWAGDVETVDAVYFLAPADAIRSAYKARGIECFLVEETQEAGEAADGHTDPAETGGDGEASGNAAAAEPTASTDPPPAGQGAPATPKPEKPAETPPRTSGERPAAAYRPKPGGAAARKAR